MTHAANSPSLREQRLLNDEVPRYFRRLYRLGDSRLMTPSGSEPLYPGREAEVLTIWGYAWASPYAEDEAAERYAWERSRGFCAWCFSELEPNGELGFVPQSEVTEVTREELIEGLTALGVDPELWS